MGTTNDIAFCNQIHFLKVIMFYYSLLTLHVVQQQITYSKLMYVEVVIKQLLHKNRT